MKSEFKSVPVSRYVAKQTGVDLHPLQDTNGFGTSLPSVATFPIR